MNYYFLPGRGIFGGIKVGFQFVDALGAAGVRIAVAVPDAQAPYWFRSMAPMVDIADVSSRLSTDDVALFSLPQHYELLKKTKARLIFHCQGTDPAIDPILADESITVLTCWKQAREYVEARGRRPIDVGISISDSFFYDGTAKRRDQVAYMPRRGAAIAEAAIRYAPHLRLQAIDNLHEDDVAVTMKRSLYYLATSEQEWFGLPALEAMAAGCVCLSVPVVGGEDYLEHGRNCLIGDRDRLPQLLADTARAEAVHLRDRLRTCGMATASLYRVSIAHRRLAHVLRHDLGDLLSWT